MSESHVKEIKGNVALSRIATNDFEQSRVNVVGVRSLLLKISLRRHFPTNGMTTKA